MAAKDYVFVTGMVTPYLAKKTKGQVISQDRRPIEGVPGKRLRLNPRCAEKHQWIVAELEKGTEKVIIAKKLHVSICTFYRYLVYTGLHKPQNCNRPCWKERGIFK